MSLNSEAVRPIIERALDEDIGDGDVTTRWTVRPEAVARAAMIVRTPGIVAGLQVAEMVFSTVDSRTEFRAKVAEGARVRAGDELAQISGPARGMLTAERTALNFLQRMSGIATLTAAYVEAVDGTGARILDTRKTAPGLRALDKYSVSMGGGVNHRIGLYDMVLMKENHIEAADGIGPAVVAVRKAMSTEGKSVKVEVEVETLAQLDDAVDVGVDRVMLDNMDLGTMREAVRHVAELGSKRPVVEASGNVTLNTVREVAETGVDEISIGALTHSVKALDVSMLFR